MCGESEADAVDMYECKGCGEPICDDCAALSWDGRCRDCVEQRVTDADQLYAHHVETVDGELWVAFDPNVETVANVRELVDWLSSNNHIGAKGKGIAIR